MQCVTKICSQVDHSTILSLVDILCPLVLLSVYYLEDNFGYYFDFIATSINDLIQLTAQCRVTNENDAIINIENDVTSVLKRIALPLNCFDKSSRIIIKLLSSGSARFFSNIDNCLKSFFNASETASSTSAIEFLLQIALFCFSNAFDSNNNNNISFLVQPHDIVNSNASIEKNFLFTNTSTKGTAI